MTVKPAVPYVFAGLWGLFGVVMLALGSHPPAVGVVATGGQFLLFHACAAMAVAAQTAFGGVLRRLALVLLLAGSGLFAGEIALHAGLGLRIPMLAPIGGGVALLGWACIAIGAARSLKA